MTQYILIEDGAKTLTIIETLKHHREVLYNSLIGKIAEMNNRKKDLINNYKIAITEIDYNIKQETYKEAYRLQSLNKEIKNKKAQK